MRHGISPMAQYILIYLTEYVVLSTILSDVCQTGVADLPCCRCASSPVTSGPEVAYFRPLYMLCTVRRPAGQPTGCSSAFSSVTDSEMTDRPFHVPLSLHTHELNYAPCLVVDETDVTRETNRCSGSRESGRLSMHTQTQRSSHSQSLSRTADHTVLSFSVDATGLAILYGWVWSHSCYAPLYPAHKRFPSLM